MISKMIGAFVVLLVGVSLVPMVARQVEVASTSISTSNVTDFGTIGYGTTVLKMVPFLFALSILGVGIAVAWSALRGVGRLGGEEEDEYINPYNVTGGGEIITREPKEIKPAKPIVHKEYKKVFNEGVSKFD